MAVDLSKVMDLADGLEIYKDLRDRIKNIPVPEVPVVGLLINNIRMPINENKYIKFGAQNGIQLTMDEVGGNTVFNLEADLRDVQINGTTIRSQGIANIPTMSTNNFGVAKLGMKYNTGITINDSGELKISPANITNIQSNPNLIQPLVSYFVPDIAFFGLAKAAGDITQSQSSTTAHTYTDEAKQAIQKMLGLDGLFGDYQNGNTASKAYAIGETFIMDGKRYKVTAAISYGGLITVGTNCALDPLDGHYVKDTDIATADKAGVVKLNQNYGLWIDSNGTITINNAPSSLIKAGTNDYRPIIPGRQHESVFYGLAKAGGDTTQSASDNPVGTYTAEAKTAIQTMLGVSTGAILIENVSGGTPTLACLPNVRYKCGEVSTLSITPPASGSCEVIFESGSTATLLTVPNTVKFPPWFDATALETGTIYDIIITDGVYGAVMSWAS